MKKNTIIWIVIIVILALLGIWYFTSMNSSPSAENTTATSTTDSSGQQVATTGNMSTTFHSIFTQGGSHECSYEQASSSAKSSNVIYISNGQMRGEFRTTTGGGTSANLMIYDGGLLYTWKEGTTVGTKTSIKTVADLPAVIPADLTSGAIFGPSSDNVSWDCHDWIRDPKQFVVPTYVKFTTKA